MDALQPILERDREKLRLDAFLDGLSSRDGGVIVIEGPPGIGKSTLLALLRERAADVGVQAPLVRCSESETRLCSGAVKHLLEQIDATSDSAPCPGSRNGRGAQFAWFEQLRQRLVEAALTAPIVLVVDDLQWADAESLRFFMYLSHRLDGVPIALAASIRTREPASRSPMVAGLVTDPAVETLRPRPLTAAALRELTVHLVGADPDDEFVAASHEATGGNPFLATELLREVAADELEPSGATARKLAALGPQAVSHSVLLRIARCGGAAAPVAQAVAVLGDACFIDDVAAVAGLEMQAAYDAADALVRAGVLHGEQILSFDHPMLRSAVHVDMTSMELALGHGRAAAALLARGASDERVAEHLLHALPDQVPWAGAALIGAARAAIGQGNPGTAENFLLRALAEPLDDGQRAEALDALSLAQTRLGKEEATQTCTRAAGTQTGAANRLRMGRRHAAALLLSGRTGEAIAVLETLAHQAAGAGRETALEIEADRLLAAVLDPAYRSAHRERARRQRSLPGSTPAERLVLAAALVYAWLDVEPADELAELAQRAMSDPHQIAEQTTASPRFGLAVAAAVEADRDDLVRGVADLSVEVAQQRGSLPALAVALGQRAILNQASGRLVEAEHDGRRSLDVATASGFRRVVLWVAPALAATLLDREGHEAAWHLLEELELTGGLPMGVPEGRLLDVRAAVHLAGGRPAEALADAEIAGERAATMAVGFRRWRGLRALAQMALGQEHAAMRSAEDAVEAAVAFGAAREIGSATLVAAAVRGGREGIGLLKRAACVLERSNARLEHARALADLGAALRRANRRTESRDPLWRAHAMAHAAGAGAVERRVAAELASAGTRPRLTVARRGLEDLTPSERRIAELAANGSSNRQIAASLVITVKTVEIHLTSVYRKLGIASRRELAAALGPSEPQRVPATV